MTREELISKYRAEAAAMAGRPIEDDELETGTILGAGDNPFAGEPGAEESHLKMKLSIAITDEIRRLGLKQREVAVRVPGLTQGDVSQIMRGKLKGFSEGRLMEILAAIGNDVEIVYRHRPDNAGGRVELMAV
jgi:predicted XRE-type DNA-binding protein